MEKVSGRNFPNKDFPWLSAQRIDIGFANCLVARINFVGELGWEIHHPIETQNHVFDALIEAGIDLGIKPFGIRAMDSLRLEKSYRLIGTELSIEYAAFESGINRFIHPDKGNFIGRDALLKWEEKGFENSFVTLEINDVKTADALGNNPLFLNGKNIGRATSGGYGFRLKKSIALGMIKPSFAKIGTNLQIDILGKTHSATVISESPYDPKNHHLRI